MSDPTIADIFQLQADFLPPSARVAGFTGQEGLSTLYHFEIGVLTDGDEIDLEAARGQALSLTIAHGGDVPYLFHGIVAEVGVLHAWQGQALYRLVLVPKVWTLTLSMMSRVFVDQTIPEIIERILKDSDITTDDYELRTQGDYAPHFHTCQYRESRWAFISRLMEREGLYYFFEQGDDREKLIITDHHSMHQSSLAAPVRYVPLSGGDDAMSTEALTVFRSNLAAVPRSVLLRDHDYLKPNLDVKAEADVWPEAGPQQKLHAEHDFRSAEAGRQPSEAMAQAWRARELGFVGRGRVFGLRPGYRFALDEHPLGSFNRDYLAVKVRHVGNQAAAGGLTRELLGIVQEDDYRVEVTALEADRQYRAPRRTPIPRIHGVERATVDGPADSEYAQIDEHGRYKVKLHFDVDDSDLSDGDASTWIRMLQPHGGATEGWHFPLRKDTEVMVLFLGGDPDRPVIAGAVPNAIQPSPVTKDNHTQNVIQTGSENRIEFEDQKPQQYIDISTPPKDTRIHLGEPHGDHSHYIVEHTDGNELIDIGGTRDIEVGGDQNEHVVGDVNEDYDSDHNQKVASHQSIEVGASRTVEVAGPQTHVIHGAVDETYMASHTTRVATTRIDEVTGAVAEDYKSTLETTVGGSVTEDFKSNQETTVAGAHALSASTVYLQSKGNFDISSGGPTSVFSAGPYKLSVPAADWFKCGHDAGVTVGTDTKMFVGAKTDVSAAMKLDSTAGLKVENAFSVNIKVVSGAKHETDGSVDMKKAAAAHIIDTPLYDLTAGSAAMKVGTLLVI